MLISAYILAFRSHEIVPRAVFAQRSFFAKRASKIIVAPKETLLSFLIGTFLASYDVTNRKALDGVNILHCTKKVQFESRISQWRLLTSKRSV